MRKILVLLFALVVSAPCFTAATLGYTPAPSAAYCIYAGQWIAVNASIGTPINYTPNPVGLFGSNGTSWYGLACDSSGNLIVSSASTASSITGGFVSGAGQPYNSASSTTSFVYPATDTKMLTLDLNRTDSYTEDGTIERPYKNLPTLVIPSTGLASVFTSPNASYAASVATALPAIPLTIYGNNSTWTVTGGLTVAAKTISYDLIDGAAVTYNYAGTDRSEKHGGAFLGNVNLTQGYLHAFGSNLSGNSNVFTVGGASTAALLYGEAITGSQKIASGGAGTLIALYNPNMTKSSGYNVDMTNGGQLLFSGGLLNTVAGTPNIYLPTANSPSTLHAISGLIVGTGTGVACASGTTTYVAYGFNLAPITNCTLLPGYQGPTNFLGAISSTVGIAGVTGGTAAGAGYVGQAIVSLIPSASAVSLTTATPANVTSITLTAGDWDVQGSVNFVATSATIAGGALHEVGFNTTSATLPSDGSELYVNPPSLSSATASFGTSIQRRIYNVSTTTTVYLVAEGTFTQGTEKVYGTITARRVH